ncbi:MAG: hypothetical protein AB1453_00455 [Chloroflexota bacterium]|jgi:hypothetical protein
MIENSASTVVTPRPKRPLGVWFLTLYAIVFLGVAPLATMIYAAATSGVFSRLNVPAADLLLALALVIGVIVSGIGAWQGNDRARIVFLIFVSANYLLGGLNNFLLIESGQAPADQHAQLWGRVLRGLIYPAIFIWYFTRKSTLHFYKKGTSAPLL